MILYHYTENENIHPQEILACFDLDLGSDNYQGIFGGHWVMYGTASQHPNVPRLIVTGFRSEDLSGYSAGGSAYVLKPFTKKTLETQVKQASILHRVKWLCPLQIQADYTQQLSSLFHRQTSFTQTLQPFLTNWLSQKRIDLEVIHQVIPNKIAESNLIVIDIFTENNRNDLDPLDTIINIRNVNPHACIIVVLPASESVENLVSNYYRRLPLHLHDGSDAIIKKPLWLANDGHAKPEEALGNLIVKQLNRFNQYDVKYQIAIPVAAVIGRCDRQWLEKGQTHTNYKLYAPLIPFLVNQYGLSARLEEIGNLLNEANQGKEQVINQINQELKNNTNNSSNDFSQEISRAIANFTKALGNRSEQQHLTLESWLRASINDTAREKFKDLDTIAEPLIKVFGGATRYEFGVHGNWYKESNRIDDLLITIEFCAKSSLMAKKFIEATVVDYLLQIAKEDCVLVQELPIRGYLL